MNTSDMLSRWKEEELNYLKDAELISSAQLYKSEI
jgi:hypothetical protein